MGKEVIFKKEDTFTSSSLILPTQSIEDLLEQCKEWIAAMEGGRVYGNNFAGKTCALNYVVQNLNQEYQGNLPIFTLLTRTSATNNEGAFWGEFLLDVGHALTAYSRDNRGRERFIRFLIYKGTMTVRKQIVLFIDGTHKLERTSLLWLNEAIGEIQKSRITVSLIMIGGMEVTKIIHFIRPNQLENIGYIKDNTHRFIGLKDVSEFTLLFKRLAILQGEDVNSFPAETMQVIYTMFLAIWKQHQRDLELPMNYLMISLTYFFSQYRQPLSIQHIEELIIKSILQSGFDEYSKNKGLSDTYGKQ
ncbi:hypothetical protein [Cohnella terricola]|uniref:ATP-binding protein n=1 Tax=Cohnella terricola TaxID=1289167 RepID=A0A559JQL1_9BACL|nr:hypothetical protein [Cohnella terricola]TVY02169.1 hypothetical protein FPZ45_06925 [Cohnella terricola]